MPRTETLPILTNAGQAYHRLWRERALHAKAIWPPVVFLVLAEFLYHRIVGNAQGLSGRWSAVLAAPWYMPVGAAVAWLIGLKFLLSFSISWRRHLLLGERFDPFFFKVPFWKYLAFLVLTYCWAIPVLVAAAGLAAVLSTGVTFAGAKLLAALPMVLAVLLILWGIIRQVPYFTALTLDPPRPGWRDSTAAMRGNVLRYAAGWIIAMLPVALANVLLDLGLQLCGADPHSVAVALGESAFRQAMLFVHFSLGASIGAFTIVAVIADERFARPGASPLDPTKA